MGIIKWNDPEGWFDTLTEYIINEPLNPENQHILDQDTEKRKRERSKAQETETMKIRNKKRRLTRIRNRIDPAGHQYASDEKEEKRVDPTRKVACSLLPSIDNTRASNCFINSIIQLLRFTKPEENMILSKNAIVSLMFELNKGRSINKESICEIRTTILSGTFSKEGQEDAAEFYSFLMNTLYAQRTFITCENSFINRLLSRQVETRATHNFEEAYQIMIQETVICNQCKNIIRSSIKPEYRLSIPATSSVFETNLNNFLHNDFTARCEKCNANVNCTSIFKICKFPCYLMIQLLRFSFDRESSSIIKISHDIKLPREIKQTILGENYTLIGVVYHIGETPTGGHYMSKHLNYNACIDTMDDSRCYSNPAETSFVEKNAYMVLYQKTSMRLSLKPLQTERERRIIRAYDISSNQKNKNTQDKTQMKLHLKSETPIISRDKFIKFIRKHSKCCSLHLFDRFHTEDKLTNTNFLSLIAELFVGIFRFAGFTDKGKIIIDIYTDLVNSHCISNPHVNILQEYFIAADSIGNDEFVASDGKKDNLQIWSTFLKLAKAVQKNVQGGLDMMKNLYSLSRHPRNNQYFESLISNLEKIS